MKNPSDTVFAKRDSAYFAEEMSNTEGNSWSESHTRWLGKFGKELPSTPAAIDGNCQHLPQMGIP
jgi:hypothetical protein